MMNLDFLTVMKKSFAALRDSQKTLAEKIDAKQAEIEHLRTATASRADVLAGIEALIERHFNDYEQAFRFHVLRLAEHATTMEKVDGVNFITGAPAGVAPSLTSAERAIMALLGGAIMPALKQRIMAMAWPGDVGPPVAERPALIEKAEKELAALVAEREEIRRQAAEAGITI